DRGDLGLPTDQGRTRNRESTGLWCLRRGLRPPTGRALRSVAREVRERDAVDAGVARRDKRATGDRTTNRSLTEPKRGRCLAGGEGPPVRCTGQVAGRCLAD